MRHRANKEHEKAYLRTPKSGPNYHPRGSLETIRRQEHDPTHPELQKKRIFLTRTPIRVAKGLPKGVSLKGLGHPSRTKVVQK